MKIQELKSLRAVVAAGFRVTAAAEAAHTSQPGISRHVMNVEQQLGVPLFERRKNRLVGLTPAGAAIMPAIDRVVEQLDGLQHIAQQYADGQAGRLTIATSHTHARYILPRAIERFIKEFPDVRLVLRQGNADQIAEWLHTGEADISLSTVPANYPATLDFHPYCTISRLALVPPRHPLLKLRRLTLAALAKFPIVTYGPEFRAHAQIINAFHMAGLTPIMALNANDTDTIKTYALCGLGIAIVADSAYERAKDKGLHAIDASHLFPSSVVCVGVNRERPIHAHTMRIAAILKASVYQALIRGRS